MATATRSTRPAKGKSSAKGTRPAKRADTSVLVTRWVGRQLWRGCRWCATETGRRGKNVAVRTGQRSAAPVRAWAADRARFGSAGAVACGDCGERVRMDRQAGHSCVADAHPPEVARFSGDAVRAEEPIKATAVRLDQHHDQPFPTRASWAARPRLADMSRKQARAYAAELRAKDRARREDAIEADLWRQAGAESPPDVDERGHIQHPTTGTTSAVVTPIRRKEVATMTDPQNWSTGAEVFAEHGIDNTDELIAFLEQTARGGDALVDHVRNFAEAMQAAHVDDGVVGSLGEAAEAAQELVTRLAEAHKKALDCYGDIPQPDFSKAS